MNNEYKLLEFLKKNLLANNEMLKDNTVFFGSTKPELMNNPKVQKYYLKNLKDNLFNGIIPNCELGKDAEAVRSSAAMIYNTIGFDTIRIDNTEYKVITYEDKLDGLKKRSGPHLDVTLEGKNERIFIEAKCLEWLSQAEKLSNSYLIPENYIYNQAAEFFIPIFKMLIKESEKKKNEYSSIYERYNSKQMTIHVLGIYNWCLASTRNLPAKIRLLNIVWDYDGAEEYQIEEREGKEYVAYANVAFRNLFKKFGVDFTVEYIRYSDFLNRVDWSNDMKHRNYLKRYEIKKTLSGSEESEEFEKLHNLAKYQGEKQEDYEKRMKKDYSDKLKIEDAFNKTESSKRYNPRENEKAYKKDELENLDDEEWCFLSNTYYTKYAVSRRGRVAFLDKDNLYHILEQDDEDSKGYLRLDPKGVYNVDHKIEVYKLIAMGFLGKQIGDGYDVHHIINDGYNCRPDNLILLTREQHNKVHSKTK